MSGITERGLRNGSDETQFGENDAPALNQDAKSRMRALLKEMRDGTPVANVDLLQSNISFLLDQRKPNAATQYLADNLETIGNWRIQPKEKVALVAYLGRLIQAGGGLKYGYQKVVANKARALSNVLNKFDVPNEGAFVEFGCGAHDPLVLPTYMYLNGFGPSYGIDLRDPEDSYRTAISMYDMLVNAKMFPGRYCFGERRPKDVLERLQHFDVRAFENGDFAAGTAAIAGKVEFHARDIAESTIPNGSVRLLASFAVLEHVSDIPGVLSKIYDMLMPGALLYHFVDMADHRSYRADGKFHALHFLTDEDCPPNLNRIRAFEVTDAHVKAGFEVLADDRHSIDLPQSFLDKLLPRYAAMPVEDVAVIKQYLVLRKPG